MEALSLSPLLDIKKTKATARHPAAMFTAQQRRMSRSSTITGYAYNFNYIQTAYNFNHIFHRREQYGSKHTCKNEAQEDQCNCQCFNEDLGDNFNSVVEDSVRRGAADAFGLDQSILDKDESLDSLTDRAVIAFHSVEAITEKEEVPSSPSNSSKTLTASPDKNQDDDDGCSSNNQDDDAGCEEEPLPQCRDTGDAVLCKENAHICNDSHNPYYVQQRERCKKTCNLCGR